MILDHLAVSAQSREAARDHIETALGLPMQPGGAHARFGTHNHLMGLNDNLYLEAIAIDPKAAPPKGARWFDLDRFTGPPRLSNWICAVPDLDKALIAFPAAGRSTALTRGDLRWDMAVPVDGKLPLDNLYPALLQWHGSLHPAQMLAPSGAELHMLSICHPKAPDLHAALGFLADTRLRFETSPTPALIAEFTTPHGRRLLT